MRSWNWKSIESLCPVAVKKGNDGQIADENGEAISDIIFSGQGRIGLVHQEELPARFVATAMAAFQGIIGKGKKKE